MYGATKQRRYENEAGERSGLLVMGDKYVDGDMGARSGVVGSGPTTGSGGTRCQLCTFGFGGCLCGVDVVNSIVGSGSDRSTVGVAKTPDTRTKYGACLFLTKRIQIQGGAAGQMLLL
ncbi:hypothetical protein PRNP1_004663 [Phytophthora ramorum]